MPCLRQLLADAPAARCPAGHPGRCCIQASVRALRTQGAAKQLGALLPFVRLATTAHTLRSARALPRSMELEQDGVQQLVALFTFVARDALTGRAHAVNPVVPATSADRAMFDQRQAVSLLFVSG